MYLVIHRKNWYTKAIEKRKRIGDLRMKATNLQDIILNTVRRDRVPVTVHLVNGVPIKGLIRGFDNFVVLVDADGKQMMIYKHAISTVTPSRPVQYTPEEGLQEAETN